MKDHKRKLDSRRSAAKLGKPEDAKVSRQADLLIDVFDTPIGWFGVQYCESVIQRIKFGLSRRSDIVRAFIELGPCRVVTASRGEHWRDAIRSYAATGCASFADLDLQTDWMTPFQKNVIAKCREIPAGMTVTYGELASDVGSPGAARAVGSVMQTNRFPIVVPCHRVVGVNGLGGFSAGQGVNTKRILLQLERSLDLESTTFPLFD